MSKETQFGPAGFIAIARHWAKHGGLMEKIITEEIVEYALSKDYTPLEMRAFREGLARTAEIYQACHTELENKNKDKESHDGEGE